MAFFIGSQTVQGTSSTDPTKKIVKVHFECDTVSDLPTKNQFSSENVILCMTSTAHVLSNNKKYEMNSTGQWIDVTEQSGSTIILDAENVNYDNTESGLTADNVQAAIDELKDDNDTQDRALVELYGEDANQQVEINYAINTGCKNYCPYTDLTASQAITILNDQPINLPSGTYILTFKYTATSGSSSFRFLNSGTSILNFTVNNTTSGTASREFTLDTDVNQIRLYTSVANTYTDVMIRSKDVRNATFKPYAPTNRELYEMILELQSSLGQRSLNTPQLRQIDETTALDIIPDFQESENDDESR